MINLNKRRVLVTYGWCRNSYAVARNLSKHGLEVYAADMSKNFMTGSSKYIKGKFIYSNFYIYPEKFISDINNYIIQNEIGFYIPVHEEILVVAKYRNNLPEELIIPIDRYENIYNLYNKKELCKLAISNNISIPETIFYDHNTDLEELTEKIKYPNIIKLQESNGAKGVRISKNKEEFVNNFNELSKIGNFKEKPPIIQEYVNGKMYAVSLLANKGQIVASFIRRNLREKDYFGGTCTKCESIHREDILNAAKKLLEKISFTGVCMLEFKVNEEENKYWLIEANPRYWGTTSHDIDCGIEFPYYQYLMGLGSKIDNIPEYKDHLISKWIIGDFISLLNTTKFSKNKIKNILSYFKFNSNFYMDLKFDDIRPFISEFKYYLGKFIKYRSTNPIEKGMIE